MATSGRGSGMVGYNVQAAVDTTNHLIVAHEVTNVGTDKSHLANMLTRRRRNWRQENLEAFADRGRSRKVAFGKQDFRYVAEEDIYICRTGKWIGTAPLLDQRMPHLRGEKLTHHFTNEVVFLLRPSH